MAAPFTAVLFDLDGTLVDSYAPIASSLNAARGAFGLPPLPAEAIRRQVGHGLESLIRSNVGPDHVEEGVRIFRATYRRAFREGTFLLAGVEPTLREIARRGLPMAIASNKPAYFSREIVEAVGLEGLFRAVLGPEMVERPKPAPDMVRLALGAMERPPESVLYVGDMTIDVDTARGAGLSVCVIPTGSHTREELARAHPDWLIERFEEILALLAGGPVSSCG